MRIFEIIFSPTGGTQKCADIFAAAFGGRIPEAAASRLKLIQGNGEKAILIAVYGNREFDDCLVELQDILLLKSLRCLRKNFLSWLLKEKTTHYIYKT